MHVQVTQLGVRTLVFLLRQEITAFVDAASQRRKSGGSRGSAAAVPPPPKRLKECVKPSQ